MENIFTQFFQEVLATLKKGSISFIVLIGFASAAARQLMDGKKKHSYGERFVIILMGGIIAYLVGGVAQTFKLSDEWLSVIGFMCGMFGYSIMKYIIDNEQAAFHTISKGTAKLIDILVDKIATWIPSKKEKNENKS